MYETSDAKKYKREFTKYIHEQVKAQNFNIVPNKTQHFYCDCIFYFDRVDKDPNNYFKLLLDSITDSQCIWIDDNVVCERVNRIYYDSKNPHIELTVYPVNYIGIFDNQDQLDQFKSNCIGCSRYKRNCGLLNNAIEGKIQEEIENMHCSKYKKLKGDK